MKRVFIRKKFTFKRKSDKKRKYKTSPKVLSIRNFLMQHSEVPKIDFSKLKIPPYLDVSSAGDTFVEGLFLPKFRFNFFSSIKIKSRNENETRIKSSFFN